MKISTGEFFIFSLRKNANIFKMNRYLLLICLFLLFGKSKAELPQRIGCWKFDNPSQPLEAEIGSSASLKLKGYQTATSGSVESDGAISIGPGSYYQLQHSISPKGGEKYVNEYSLLFDFKVHDLSVWHSFFQTDVSNSNDGDFFINPSGNIGIATVGYSGYSVKPDEWYRMIVAVDNGNRFTCYLDGKILIEGTVQPVDDRFSLEDFLLIFADENGEDGEISCSELAIWDRYLTIEQASELGGFGHIISSAAMVGIPYLQSPGTNSMVVCWHDTLQNRPVVSYGIDKPLSNSATGVQEPIKYSYYWNTVSLEGLLPNTTYYYQLHRGNDTSGIYAFKTLPDTNDIGTIRFIILGDTHASDTTMTMKILKEARKKLESLYGSAIENHVQAILHSGDLVVNGNSIDDYTTQFFNPMATLSGNLATMAVAGNHEAESPFFYRYMKLDKYSAFPDQVGLTEKVWKFRVGNSLFLGMNTNITSQYGDIEASWLDQQLNAAETNSGIDFVFLIFHHPPYSELWHDVVNFDEGPNFITNKLFPIIKKYSKVQQINYGHTHGFERGTILSEQTGNDFRIICGGGGGGPLDGWIEGVVCDYPSIHKSYSEYFFQLLEIDIANKTYKNSVYSIGNLNNPTPLKLLDQWYKRKNQSPPATPEIKGIEVNDGLLQLNLSQYSGVDSLMSVQLQISDADENQKIVVDTMFHWQNIFGVDTNGMPINLNQQLKLDHPQISIQRLPKINNLIFKVRYRDHNLKWSEWSTGYGYDAMGMNELKHSNSDYFLGQNYPNPFETTTTINYHLPVRDIVKFNFMNCRNQIVASRNEKIKESGDYEMEFMGSELCNGVYFYQMITNNVIMTKKMIKTN